MKKINLLVLLFLFAAVAVCFADGGGRYIVFFADTADIPQPVIDKMLLSKRFCMAVPINSDSRIPDNLEELVSYGKLEPALAFEPEPVFPVLASVYADGKKTDKLCGFTDFVSDNVSSFGESVNKDRFGIFLHSGAVSNNILYYFSNLRLSWVNIDNTEEDFSGVYEISGIPAFSIYKNFPTAQKDVMKWLEGKKDAVVPVLLTSKHLSDPEFMGYVIDLFDRSKYIKPAVPMFIVAAESGKIWQKKDVAFDQLKVKNTIMSKLYSAASSIGEYKSSKDFTDYAYKNAQSELMYLCSYDLLKSVSANKVSGQRMFDAAYNNIYRLLGAQLPSGEKAALPSKGVYAGTTEEVLHTNVEQIDGGVSITNSGIIKSVSVTADSSNINIVFAFDGDKRDPQVSFIDFYIDLNNIEGAGLTSMLSGANGFLTPDSAWEYALRIDSSKASLYKYSAEEAVFVADFPVDAYCVAIPQKYIKGNPANWGFQAVAVIQTEGKSKIIDFLAQSSQSRENLLAVKPLQIPAMRIKR